MHAFTLLMGHLFGTARRFWTTMTIAALAFVCFRPEVLKTAITNLLGAVVAGVTPFVPQILTLAIICFGIRFMFRGHGGGRKNGH